MFPVPKTETIAGNGKSLRITFCRRNSPGKYSKLLARSIGAESKVPLLLSFWPRISSSEVVSAMGRRWWCRDEAAWCFWCFLVDSALDRDNVIYWRILTTIRMWLHLRGKRLGTQCLNMEVKVAVLNAISQSFK